MAKQDGGPAFPRPASEYTGSGTCPDGNDAIPEQVGMTLRDWFAGAAIYGAAAQIMEPDPLPAADVAKWAYQLADAMIQERAKE